MACSMHPLLDMNPTKNREALRTGADLDDALAAAAQGVAPTSDDADALLDGEARRETDVIGKAAGVAVADGEPLGGPDKIDRRDAHRWELDPASADEVAAVDDTSRTSQTRIRRHSPAGER